MFKIKVVIKSDLENSYLFHGKKNDADLRKINRHPSDTDAIMSTLIVLPVLESNEGLFVQLSKVRIKRLEDKAQRAHSLEVVKIDAIRSELILAVDEALNRYREHSPIWEIQIDNKKANIIYDIEFKNIKLSNETILRFYMEEERLFFKIERQLHTIESIKKIAVLGTCFSRNAFNSIPYFNPGYKKNFNCYFTQFHSSIISLVTSAYCGLNVDNYSDITDVNKIHVKNDFEKHFFQKLAADPPDYLIIDLYSDAIKSVLFIDDITAVTFSPIIEQSIIRDDIDVKRILDHENNAVYFHEWKKYLGIFIENLEKIISLDKVILNKGQFTTAYYDEMGNIVQYSNVEKIDKMNNFWQELNNYFMDRVPQANEISLKGRGYIGDYHYPFGHSISHYQSLYYKDFMKELISLTHND